MHATSSPDPPTPPPGPRAATACRNCGHAGVERFCAHCGQSSRELNLPFRELVDETLGGFFAFDKRVLRTLGPLLSRPGLLTLEYLNGRRARYVPPLKLYLFVSFVIFVLSAVLDDDSNKSFQFTDSQGNPIEVSGAPDGAGDAGEARADAEPAAPPSAAGPPEETAPPIEQDSPAARADADADADETDPGTTADRVDTGSAWFDRLIENAIDNPELVNRVFEERMPSVLFLLVPVYALMLRLLHWRSDRYYFAFLIFVFHAQTVVFLTIGLMTLLVGALSVSDDLASALFLLPALSFFIAQRRVFGRRGWRQLVTFAAATAGYLAITLAGLAGNALVVLLSL